MIVLVLMLLFDPKAMFQRRTINTMPIAQVLANGKQMHNYQIEQ